MGKSIGLGSVEIRLAGGLQVARKMRYSRKGFLASYRRYVRASGQADTASWPAAYAEIWSQALPSPDNAFAGPLNDFRDRMDKNLRLAISALGRAPAGEVLPPIRSGGDLEERTYAWFVQNDKTGEQCLKPIAGRGLQILEQN